MRRGGVSEPRDASFFLSDREEIAWRSFNSNSNSNNYMNAMNSNDINRVDSSDNNNVNISLINNFNEREHQRGRRIRRNQVCTENRRGVVIQEEQGVCNTHLTNNNSDFFDELEESSFGHSDMRAHYSQLRNSNTADRENFYYYGDSAEVDLNNFYANLDQSNTKNGHCKHESNGNSSAFPSFMKTRIEKENSTSENEGKEIYLTEEKLENKENFDNEEEENTIIDCDIKNDFYESTWRQCNEEIQELSFRGLKHAATWLSEMMDNDYFVSSKKFCEIPSMKLNCHDVRTYQSIILGKCYMDNGEYMRAFDRLQKIDNIKDALKVSENQIAVFIKNFSLYKLGELKKERTIMESVGYLKEKDIINENLETIFSELRCYQNQLDSYNLWLLAIVFRDLKKFSLMRLCLLESLHKNKLNWSAWEDFIESLNFQSFHCDVLNDTSVISKNVSLNLESEEQEEKDEFDIYNEKRIQFFLESKNFAENQNQCKKECRCDDCISVSDFNMKKHKNLSDCLKNFDDSSLKNFEKSLGFQKSHWIHRFAYALHCMKTKRNRAAILHYKKLIKIIGHSTYIYSQLAKCSYEIRSYGFSLRMFAILHDLDAYQIENATDLASIFMMKGLHEELGQLAKRCLEINKFSPITCCVLGNWYSAKGQHKKSLKYFQRATQLDTLNISSWILMGHEYLELKNASQAIRAYTFATNINRNDARGWYGLGKAYELLEQFQLAKRYYESAVVINPDDYRLWDALGNCYRDLDKLKFALHFYLKCWECGRQLPTLVKIWKSYEKLEGMYSEAACLWSLKLFHRYVDARYYEEFGRPLPDISITLRNELFEEDIENLKNERDIRLKQSTLPLLSCAKKSEKQFLWSFGCLNKMSDFLTNGFCRESSAVNDPSEEVEKMSLQEKKEDKSEISFNVNQLRNLNLGDLEEEQKSFVKNNKSVNEKDTMNSEEARLNVEILKCLQNPPLEIIETLVFIMKYYKHTRQDSEKLRIFAKYVFEVGGDHVEEAKNILSEYSHEI